MEQARERRCAKGEELAELVAGLARELAGCARSSPPRGAPMPRPGTRPWRLRGERTATCGAAGTRIWPGWTRATAPPCATRRSRHGAGCRAAHGGRPPRGTLQRRPQRPTGATLGHGRPLVPYARDGARGPPGAVRRGPGPGPGRAGARGTATQAAHRHAGVHTSSSPTATRSSRCFAAGRALVEYLPPPEFSSRATRHRPRPSSTSPAGSSFCSANGTGADRDLMAMTATSGWRGITALPEAASVRSLIGARAS